MRVCEKKKGVNIMKRQKETIIRLGEKKSYQNLIRERTLFLTRKKNLFFEVISHIPSIHI